MKTNLATFFLLLSSALLPVSMQAQQKATRMVVSGVNAEKVVTAEKLKYNVEFLTDSLFNGRRTGTKGACEAAFWVARKFRNASLMPIGGLVSQSFQSTDVIGHNIMGFMPGQRDNVRQKYIIVSAHYDSYGVMNGVHYPGADSNASGVAAMTSLAEMFAEMKKLGRDYGSNLIFVAFDAKELNSAGAEAFWNALSAGELKDPVSGETISPDKIHAMISLDIIGSSLSPLKSGRPDYLIMLSGGHFAADLADANKKDGLGLDLAFNYYGSDSFTRMFYNNVGDQQIFVQNGVRCAVFTSGITMNTNKPSDAAETLDYDILRKRIILIFHWLTKMM